MRLMRYDYTIEHMLRELLHTDDTVSRNPLNVQDDCGDFQV